MPRIAEQLQERSAQANLRGIQIIVAALCMGVVAFAAVASFVAPGMQGGEEEAANTTHDMLRWLGLLYPVMILPAAFLVRAIFLGPLRGSSKERAKYTESLDDLFALLRKATIIPCAIAESAGLLGAVVLMLTNDMLLLVPVVLCVGTMASFFPTADRIKSWLEG